MKRPGYDVVPGIWSRHSLGSWFVPPVVIPAGLIVLVAAYVLFHATPV